VTPTPKQILEGLLFASDAPVPLSALVEVLDGPDASEVAAVLAELGREYDESERGVALAEIAGGYQILSRRECAPWIEAMLRSRRKARLSRAGLETLAIVAYKQPIARAQISAIRGVNVDATLKTLVARGYIEESGHETTPGNPTLFSTTRAFLERLGIDSLSELPPLADFVPESSLVEALERGLRGTDVELDNPGETTES
jgi:segregation and condensation protein B